MKQDELYGLMAEFTTEEALLAAARAVRAAGFGHVEAYSPFPVEGLAEVVGYRRSPIPLLTLIAAIIGGVGGYFMQWYAAVVSYPFDIGGRPAHSWPMFIPVTFEMTILCGALTAFVAAIAGSGLPRLSHPVFNASDFDLASRDRFFLCLRADEAAFDLQRSGELLDAQKPVRRVEVPE